MTTTPASVLMVGFGLGGRVFHAPLISVEPRLRLDAVVTSNAERAAQARAAHAGITVHGSLGEALEHGYDLVVVSTANITHVPYAEAALRAGSHVVLDKPLAPTADDVQHLTDLANAKSRLLIPFQNRRWDTDFLTVRRIAGEGTIGRIHRYDSHFERMRVVPKDGWRNSTEPADMGGMLYDLGAHIIDQALQLMGGVTSVTARARTVRTVDGSDDDVIVMLDHESGAVSTLFAGQAGAFTAPTKTIFGTHGGVRVDAIDNQEAALVSGRLPDETWYFEPEGTEALQRVYAADSSYTDSRIPLDRGRWPDFYAGVSSAILDGTEPPVLATDAVQNARVMDAAFRSAATSETVHLHPPARHG